MDSNNIERFLEGQRFGYEQALAEIRNGLKTGHWVWYVFPQMRGLGRSPNSTYYGIGSLAEARSYLEHPVLGTRLREITGAFLSHRGRPAESVLGGIDAMKVRSCMTLFDVVSPGDVFADVLDEFYGGRRCRRTLDMLGHE